MHAPLSIHGATPEPIPAAAGIGLRGPHHQEFIDTRPEVAWLEVHSENYMSLDSVATAALTKIRQSYPISLHGVGMSIGSTDSLNTRHLKRLRRLVERVEPGLVSEHLSWGSINGRYLHDLLPLPYTEEALDHVVDRINVVQAMLNRLICIENVSSYLQYAHSTIDEPEFLVEVATRTGCGILLDINNVYVSASNHGFSPIRYIDAIPADHVIEIHLAGHSEQTFDGQPILVDTHDSPVCGNVWSLFELAQRRFPSVPVLIEWDSKLPSLKTLLAEAQRAQQVMDSNHAIAA